MWNIIKFLEFENDININNTVENKDYSIPIIFCLIFIIFILIFIIFYKINEIEKNNKNGDK